MSTLINEATIKVRRDSASNWTSNNPTLNQGEWALETDSTKLKIGDGSTAWASLGYQPTASDLDNVITGILHVQDQKTAGTHGGTFTSGAWRTRDLNTVITNTITGASLATNQITLPAGTYKVTTSAPAYQVNRHGTYFYNITDSKAELLSQSAKIGVAAQTYSLMLGIITITGTKVFEVQHKCQSTYATFGYGIELNSSLAWDHETYTDVFIEKIGL